MATSSYVCVLDFEATCEQDVKLDVQEIIEFPSVLLEFSATYPAGRVVNEIQMYLRPAVHPKLSAFCTELTGITQAQVDGGVPSLSEALTRHQEWLASSLPSGTSLESVLLVTCGDWDLATMLPHQAKHFRLSIPHYLTSWLNIKTAFADFYYKRNRFCRKPIDGAARSDSRGMAGMLRALKLPLEGRHHSGIDDCRNIAKIVQRMVTDGFPLHRSASMEAQMDFRNPSQVFAYKKRMHGHSAALEIAGK